MINFDLRTEKAYGENTADLKMSFLIDNWHEVDGDLKDSIWTDITVFIMNFLLYFTSIYDHLICWFNNNINSINYVNVWSVYCFKGKYTEKLMDCICLWELEGL